MAFSSSYGLRGETIVGTTRIDLRSQGATGNGVDDDADGLDKVIDTMPFGATLCSPLANYRISRPLKPLNQRCELDLDIGAKFIASADMESMLKVTGSNCQFSNVYLDDGGHTIPKMFWITTTGNEFNRFRTAGTGSSTALYFDDAVDLNNGCWVQSLWYPQIHMGDNVNSRGIYIGKNANSIRIFGQQIHHCGIGIDVGDTLASLSLHGGDIEFNSKYGVRFQTDNLGMALNNAKFSGVYFEKNNIADVFFPDENSANSIYPLLMRGISFDTCYFELNNSSSLLDHIYIGNANLASHSGLSIENCRFGNKGATINGRILDSSEKENWTLTKSGTFARSLHRIGSTSNGDHVEIETTSQVWLKGSPTADLTLYLSGVYQASLKAASGYNTIQSSTNLEVIPNGGGFVCKTPDGTKRYRLSVDNGGVITSTLLS